MAWFIEKTMRFRFKFCDFDLYINILIIFKFHNVTSHTTWFACYITHCCICTGVVCNAEHFNYIWYYGTMVLWYYGTMVLFASIFVELNNNPWCR